MTTIGPPRSTAPAPAVEFAEPARELFARELALLHASLDQAFNEHKSRAVDANLYGIWILINASNDIEKNRRTSLFRRATKGELKSAGLVAEAEATYYFYETFGYCFTIVLRQNIWHVLHFLRLQERTPDGRPGRIHSSVDSLKAFAVQILQATDGSA